MCGLLGIAAHRPGRDPARLSVAALRNRGPDHTGYHGDPRVGLYHTRLAVIDRRAASNQPLVSPCGRYAVICNGEIYNHEDLRRRVPYDYRTTSDCEVILACYAAEGPAGFRHLKGMFAFGLYDAARQRLLVVRDAVGKKPLFTYQDGDVFLFASSVAAITENVRRSWVVDPEALVSYLRDGYIRPDRAFYRDIRPLLPGTILDLDIASGRCELHRLTPEGAGGPEPLDGDPAAWAREAERRLDQSVARRVHGIEAPVLLFSGGIDSTVLAKKLLALTGRRLTCVALRPLVPMTYDEPYGRYAARRLGVVYRSVGLPWRRTWETLELAVSLLDQPFAVPAYYLLTYLTREARAFGNVVYLGEGGDEVFYGYDDIRAWFSTDRPAPTDSPAPAVGPPLPPTLSAWGRRQATVDLLGHAFVKVDKATAEQQMEGRCPYLDWDLMAFMRRVPPALLLAGGRTKPWLKAMLPEFPRWFVERPKIGTGFNFRYALLPWYRTMYRRTAWGALADLEGAAPPTYAPADIFRQFEWYWRRYVLSSFLR